jgi:hypothetical protein
MHQRGGAKFEGLVLQDLLDSFHLSCIRKWSKNEGSTLAQQQTANGIYRLHANGDALDATCRKMFYHRHTLAGAGKRWIHDLYQEYRLILAVKLVENLVSTKEVPSSL